MKTNSSKGKMYLLNKLLNVQVSLHFNINSKHNYLNYLFTFFFETPTDH